MPDPPKLVLIAWTAASILPKNPTSSLGHAVQPSPTVTESDLSPILGFALPPFPTLMFIRHIDYRN